MAAKLVSHPRLLSSLAFTSKPRCRELANKQQQPWQELAWRRKRLVVSASSIVDLEPSSSASLFLLAADSVGYSLASYYTSLGLFVISVPGLWSLIKRSVKSKIVQKTYVVEDGEKKKTPNQVAGEILSFFTLKNFVVCDRGETITFEGMMVPSRSQAALLTFCTCISLASVALVLTITVPEFGNNWYWITVFSPLAGAYYWKRASRKEQIKVKMMVADDGTLSEIVVQGDDQQVEQMRKELQFTIIGKGFVSLYRIVCIQIELQQLASLLSSSTLRLMRTGFPCHFTIARTSPVADILSTNLRIRRRTRDAYTDLPQLEAVKEEAKSSKTESKKLRKHSFVINQYAGKRRKLTFSGLVRDGVSPVMTTDDG
ncbi:hypothetical protein Nepgr_008732 [Nepenthes gracilis]|uniref:Protein COFACTOR ASSEMBLY OF COMPLEX C SUBUNIT B CCB1, chloroplastic n=1 Tax=Nepenthes gracilis TaxID=150966 RepID=A0AAD3S9G1_NEPGR|nr:hypothetical protein Nepgr_008732 [Nepenthes gracilis]